MEKRFWLWEETGEHKSRRIYFRDARLSCRASMIVPMSYTVTLWCGCEVYISADPTTGMAHSRIVEARGKNCPIRRHEIGARLWLWELLPDPRATGGASAETLTQALDES
jgi:hypothetical protein